MRKEMIVTASLALVVLTCVSTGLLASTASDFGGQEFLDQSNKIQGFLFGPAMRFVGVMGGAYGLIQAVFAASVRPLMVYGGIGMGVSLVPKFIDGVFSVSGMLISQLGG